MAPTLKTKWCIPHVKIHGVTLQKPYPLDWYPDKLFTAATFCLLLSSVPFVLQVYFTDTGIIYQNETSTENCTFKTVCKINHVSVFNHMFVAIIMQNISTAKILRHGGFTNFI